MTRQKWIIAGITIILGLVGLGFAAMSTNPPFIVPVWLPILFFILAGLATFVLVAYLMWEVVTRLRVQSPIIMSGQIPAAKLPPLENKIALVARAIMEARQVIPAGKDVPVYITASNGLKGMFPQEIRDILVKLQDDERVITLKSFPEWLLPDALDERSTIKDITNKKIEAMVDPSKNHFVVSVLNSFDKWYKRTIKK